MSAATADKPKATGRKKGAAESNGSGTVEEAHAALGTGANIDLGPQDVHAGDEEGLPPTDGPLQLSMQVGGKKPTSTTLRVTGGKLDTDRVFQKGQKVHVSAVLVVGEVGFVDQTDSATGQVVGCERRHKARIVDFAIEG